MKPDEEVLCIPAARIASFTGFRPYDEMFAQAVLDAAHFTFLPRSRAETDVNFLQLIPYVVLTCGKEVFAYTRGNAGTETRLASLRSVGIGGHINPIDGSGADAYRAGMLREVNEETEIISPYREKMLGFIHDPRTPVGQVHLGIVHQFELAEPFAWPRESAIADAGFRPIRELLRSLAEFETWSQFVLETLHA